MRRVTATAHRDFPRAEPTAATVLKCQFIRAHDDSPRGDVIEGGGVILSPTEETCSVKCVIVRSLWTTATNSVYNYSRDKLIGNPSMCTSPAP